MVFFYFHKKINEKYIKSGDVNFVYKDFPLNGKLSILASEASYCAQEQGKFWQYHNTLFNNWAGENNGWAGQDNILIFAQQVGLDMDEFTECTSNNRYEQKISASNADAQTLGITGTPAFYILSMENKQIEVISGAQPYDVFEKIFNTLLEN